MRQKGQRDSSPDWRVIASVNLGILYTIEISLNTFYILFKFYGCCFNKVYNMFRVVGQNKEALLSRCCCICCAPGRLGPLRGGGLGWFLRVPPDLMSWVEFPLLFMCMTPFNKAP